MNKLWRTASFVIIIVIGLSIGQEEDEGGDKDQIEMSYDRMMGEQDRCVENLDGLTTCTVKRGSTVGFSGTLFVQGSTILDLKVDLKWTTLGVTSFTNEQTCQINGQVYFGTEKCKSGNGDNTIRVGLHHQGPTADSAFFFKLPDSGSLATDLANLTATVTWGNVSKTQPVYDYLINSMIVNFSDV